MTLRRERLELPDGDFIDIDWTTGKSGPIIIILHGLEGSIESGYASAIMRQIHLLGYRGALIHFRGCSGEPNRLERSYHSGDTKDFDLFIRRLRAQEPHTSMAAVGYSLGGNALLKWLGETHDAKDLLTTAVAVSVPFRLDQAAKAMNRGFSKIYQRMLVKRLQESVIKKFANRPDAEFKPPNVESLNDFYSFDDKVTAPLHGFTGADDYYTRCSSRQFLKDIQVQTLLIHAIDDPFMTPETVPRENELSPSVTLELSPTGGHVGFVSGYFPWKPRYWLEERVAAHLKAKLVYKAT